MRGSTLAFRSTPDVGSYTVKVTASGNGIFENGNNWRMLEITVRSSANDPPTVDAGQDQTVNEGDAVTLNGTASDPEGDHLTYLWSHDSALSITVSDAASPLTTFTAPAVDSDATVTFVLSVSDGTNTAVTDQVTITIQNVPANEAPTVDAGQDQTVNEGDAVTLNGTASDPEGDHLTYLWSHDSALSITVSDAASPLTTFTAPAVDSDATVTFVLSVSDGTNTAVTDQVTITIQNVPANEAPTVDAGQDQTVNEGDAVTLNGTASDPEGDHLTYLWSHDSALSITVSNATSQLTTFTAPAVGSDVTVTFVLSVSDGTNTDVTDQVTITIQDVPTNNPPTVDAGQDQTVNEGDAVTLSGTASDPEGGQLTYLWSHDSVLPITVSNATSPLTTFTAPLSDSDTVIAFTLNVTDGAVYVHDTMTVTVRGMPVPDIADVTSITPDGPYHPGQIVDVRINFTRSVNLEAFTIQDGGRDTAGGTFTIMDRPSGLATVQIGDSRYALVSTVYDDGVQIIDITDPASPVAVAAIADGTSYPNLAGGYAITTVQRGNLYYALVASQSNNGVQIINITDPASPTPVAAFNDGATYTELLGAYSITTTQIGDSHYALVTGFSDHGVQIINITDIANPAPAAALQTSRAYSALLSPTSVTTVQIGDSHYALVASKRANGVQIINITDPVRPSPVTALIDGQAYQELEGAYSITTTQIGNLHYALVAADSDDGVQIIDITDPAHPLPVAALTDGQAYPELEGATSITTTQIGDSHYALVASIHDDGVQIIDITDPAHPLPVAALTDGQAYPELEGARTVITTQIGDSHYALVAGVADKGIQIIDITDPAHPFNPLMPYMRMDLDGDRRATYVGQAHGNHTLIFEYVVKDGDQTGDLAYSGIDALVLGHSGLTDTGDSSNLSNVTLPEPGAPHSLSHNKQIDLRAWPNGPPTVDAGQDQTVNEGDILTLNGTASDPEGDQLTYLWSHDSAPPITVSNATSPLTTFTAPAVDSDVTVTFVLSVSDGTNTDVTDQVTITIQDVPANDPPTVDAGQDQTVDEGDTLTLNGTASDADGDAMIYLWSHDSDLEITLDNPSSVSVSFTVPQVTSNATITFTMTVTDKHNATGSDAVVISILDIPADDSQDPIADQFQKNTVVWNMSDPHGSRDIIRITLSSAAPGTIHATWDVPGEAPANYRVSWAKTGESYLPLTNSAGNTFPSVPSQTITGLEEGGEYMVKVLAGYGDTAGDWSGDVIITVARSTVNQLTVRAVPDQTVSEMSVLEFTVTVDGDGHPADTLVYGLDGAPTGALIDPTTGEFEWTPAENQDGHHTIVITASDSGNRTATSHVNVAVGEVNMDPVLDKIPDLAADDLSVVTFILNATDDDRHPGVGAETVVGNLRIPWSIDWTPDGTALFTERDGNLRVIYDGVLESEPLLSIDVGDVEGGLLGLAVDPDFEENQYIYLYYTYTENSVPINKVVRYQFSNGTVTEDMVLLDGIPGAQYHDGGRIQFGPDEKLYITTGDAGNPSLAQDSDSLAGKILRINRDGTVPAGNPFANSTVWSIGHRNPQGIDWDEYGNLVASEHGPSGGIRGSAHDEINLIVPGANYGWPDIIGGDSAEGLQTPILHSGRETWAPSGAEFYDGDKIAGWTGKYFVAALRGAHLHMIDIDPQTHTVLSHEKLFQDEFGRLRDVQTGPDGFLYVLTSNRDGRGTPESIDDRILRIVPVFEPGSERPANSLTYGLDGASKGASVNQITGVFTWETPNVQEDSVFTFNVTVSDGAGGAAVQTVTIRVDDTHAELPRDPRDIGVVTLNSTVPGIVDISWDAPSQTPANYRVSWAKAGEPYLARTDPAGNAFPTVPFHTITGLEEGGEYRIKVRASYSGTSGDWSDEVTATVAESPVVPNTHATGLPVITGTVQVGYTLTADISGIADADGITGVSFNYRWISDNGTAETEIGGGGGGEVTAASRHVLTADDLGDTIKVRVEFTDDAGHAESLTSAATHAVAPAYAVPGVPANLLVSQGDSGGILKVSWQAPASNGGSNLTGYTVQWKATSDSWAIPADIAEVTLTGTTHTITGLTDGTPYAVRVLATNVIGDGKPTSEETATPQAPVPLRDPRDIGVVTLNSTVPGIVTVSWDAPGQTPANYRVSWAKAGEPYLTWTDPAGNAFPTVPFHTITGLEEGGEYRIKVRASYSGTSGDWSDEVTATVAESPVVPNTPATGMPVITGTVQVGYTLTADISGIADADGITGVSFNYRWISDNGTAETEIGGGGGDGVAASRHVLTTDDLGDTIKVRVAFTDDAGHAESLTSAATHAVAPAYAVPGVPANLLVSQGDSGGILKVSWQAPASNGGSNLTGYTVQWKAASGNWTVPADVSEATATGTTHTITGLTDGTPYTVRIIATNHVGDGESTPESTAIPMTSQQLGPRDIGRVTLSSTTLGVIDSSWVAPTEAPAAYRISWANVGGSYKTWTDPSGNAFTATTSQTITGLERGEAYKVKVRATYAGTSGDWSDDVIITVTETVTNTLAIGPPAVQTGDDQTVGESDTVRLSDSATDPDDDPITYTWSQTDPTTPLITFANASAPSTTFTAPSVTGDTVFTLVLTADDGTQSATDTLSITVKETGTAFITTWTASDSDRSITLPMEGTYSILWGDGTYSADVSGSQSHTYGAAGTYTVIVLGEGLEYIRLYDDSANARQLGSIEQWGDTKWTVMEGAFGKAANMVYRATDVPDLSGVTDMTYMFFNAASFDGDLSYWNVSGVTDMSGMFRDTTSFNGNLSAWDVSRVTDMDNVFHGATSFNGDLSSWNVSGVTDMDSMFFETRSFNGNLSAWDVSEVTGMFAMFHDAASFNGNLSAWNVSEVTDMSGMFHGATYFNGDLSAWNVSGVTDMRTMFHEAGRFNGDLSAWNVSGVTDMNTMFDRAISFNGNLSAWDVSEVTDMNGMFYRAISFNGDLSTWDVSKVTKMIYMFRGATSFNGDISSWDVSRVTEMSGMFHGATSFNGDISSWDVSRVTDMSDMFYRATSFNGDISSWDVSRVTDMSDMFYRATSFNQNLGAWYVVLDGDTMPSSTDSIGIAAQNRILNDQNPVYTIDETATNGDKFRIANGTHLALRADQTVVQGQYNVTIKSTGSFGVGNSRIVEITVGEDAVPQTNNPPSVEAGPAQVVPEGSKVRLNGSATDTDGDQLTYSWSHNSTLDISLVNASAPSTTFTAPQVTGDTVFTLVLTANDGTYSATDALSITVKETGTAFITTWTASNSDRSITLPIKGAYSILWGDGTYSANVGGSQSHTYGAVGTYTVTVLGDGLGRIHLYSDNANARQLRSIEQWGDTKWISMYESFYGAVNMVYRATDAPNLSGVTNMNRMFAGATAINGDLSGWNVSSVTDMSSMFYTAYAFNGNLSGWDVSSVTTMRYMFFGAHAFNGNLSGWDVSSVTTMNGMFSSAHVFNGNLSGWDVSSVTDMGSMFYEAVTFNQLLDGWDVSSVTDMDGMFHSAYTFNQSLDDWDVSSVTYMRNMFYDAVAFNQNLGTWYIVPAGTDFDAGGDSLIVTTVSAQNLYLGGHNLTYGIGSGGDSDLFEMTGSTLAFKSAPNADSYTVKVTASGNDVFENGNNWRMLEITVHDSADG